MTTTPEDSAEAGDLMSLPPTDLADDGKPEYRLDEAGITNVDDALDTRPERAVFQRREDEPALVMGDDGDDVGQLTKVKFRVDGNGDPERLLASLAPADLIQSGHGFMVRDLGDRPNSDWPTNCELCGAQLIPPAGEWLCQVGNLPGDADWDTCACNWCLLRGQWLRGEYRPKGGRPAKRCGTAECTRRAARERQRRSRARRSGCVTETPLKVGG